MPSLKLALDGVQPIKPPAFSGVAKGPQQHPRFTENPSVRDFDDALFL
jgi:hypothetical protein